MPMMNPDELAAKSRIAAALIQSGRVVIPHNPEAFSTDPWSEINGLLELHLVTQKIYDAISASTP